MLEEIIMLEEMHADPMNKNDPCRPNARIVRQIVDMAECQDQLPARAPIAIIPYELSAMAIFNEFIVGMSVYLDENKISLAYCEDPKFIWVDYKAIRKIEKQDWGCYHSLKENGDWNYLLRLLWTFGNRLAKVQFLEDDVDIKTYGL